MNLRNMPSYMQYLVTPDIADELQAGDVPAITYLGFWQQGALGVNPLAEPKWLIKRVTTNAGITITEYANGSQESNQVWNDRAALDYSLLK